MGIYVRFLKRPLDILLSILALLCLSPVILIIAVLVRIKLGRPVIFRQERPGKNEESFRICKFRTMTEDRDKEGNICPDCVRLTPFGIFLRETSLDELPELWNILKGEMSIIGPRPLLPCYLPYYSENERHRHDVKPGLSGLAQIHGRNRIGWNERLEKDTEYVSHITFAEDLKIILITLLQVIKKEDVEADTCEAEGSLSEIREAALVESKYNSG